MIVRHVTQVCPYCKTPRSVISGASLRELRKAAGKTLKEVARGRTSIAHLSAVERDLRAVTPRVKEFYEECLGGS